MRKRKIRYSEAEGTYWFKCPFCGEKLVLPDDCCCEHVIFAYEDVNARPLIPPPDWAAGFLARRPVDYLDGFLDLWEAEYAPAEEDEMTPEEVENLKEEAIESYLEESVSLEDVLRILGAPEFRGMKQHMVLAQTEEDPDLGRTSVLLYDGGGPD